MNFKVDPLGMPRVPLGPQNCISFTLKPLGGEMMEGETDLKVQIVVQMWFEY